MITDQAYWLTASWFEYCVDGINLLEVWFFVEVYSEVATGGVLLKKVFLKISQNSQENTCASVSFLMKLQTRDLQCYLKGDSGTGVFP